MNKHIGFTACPIFANQKRTTRLEIFTNTVIATNLRFQTVFSSFLAQIGCGLVGKAEDSGQGGGIGEDEVGAGLQQLPA